MNIDEAIDRLSNCHPITKEDKEVFDLAVESMKFTRDFLPLGASPERMKHALNLLNSLDYIFSNMKTTENPNHIETIGKTEDDFSTEALVNKMCKSEDDHEWECCGISTVGSNYRCKKCYAYKTVPCNHHLSSVTI